MELESPAGSTIHVLTEPPSREPTSFGIIRVKTLEEHRSAIEVANEGFGFDDRDAADERERAEETFDAERLGGQSVRLLALEAGEPVATIRGWYAPAGLYLGGAATVPARRGRGAMSALLGATWDEAIRVGTPALVAHTGAMSTALFERAGFRAFGVIHHLIDRPDRSR
jgi:GNAT superfamily N-acetyltransferase